MGNRGHGEGEWELEGHLERCLETERWPLRQEPGTDKLGQDGVGGEAVSWGEGL